MFLISLYDLLSVFFCLFPYLLAIFHFSKVIFLVILDFLIS